MNEIDEKNEMNVMQCPCIQHIDHSFEILYILTRPDIFASNMKNKTKGKTLTLNDNPYI